MKKCGKCENWMRLNGVRGDGRGGWSKWGLCEVDGETMREDQDAEDDCGEQGDDA